MLVVRRVLASGVGVGRAVCGRAATLSTSAAAATTTEEQVAAAQAVEVSPDGVVVLRYSALLEASRPDARRAVVEALGRGVARAYGLDGLGILAVRDVPGVVEKRQALLPLARRLASLGKSSLAEIEHPQSSYSFGWSHGREKFNGKPDLAKGSFYANPQYNEPTKDVALRSRFPEYCTPNIWPTKDLPDLEVRFRDLGSLVVSVGLLVARQCDNWVHSIEASYPKDYMYRTIHDSLCCKARLLHYFPAPKVALEEGNEDSWCGWHLDHGSLTGLVPAMYLDESLKEIACPDPKSGLYIRDRSGKVHKISVPKEYLAFQIGESSQVASGGLLRATPHMVKASAYGESVSRETLAVFMQPTWSDALQPPTGRANADTGVPQWKAGMDFAAFTKATMANYY